MNLLRKAGTGFIAVFILFTLMFTVSGCTADATSGGGSPAQMYTVTFDPNVADGVVYSGQMEDLRVPAGIEITLAHNGFTRDGWIFTGWNTKADGSGESYADAATIKPSADIVLFAQWKENPSGNTVYKVVHLQQTVDGLNYIEFESENLKGNAGEMTKASSKTYTGFTAEDFEQLTVAEDGSTVVEIKYNRITVFLTIDFDDGLSTTLIENGKISGLYGAPVLVEDPVKEGFIFSGWNEKDGKLPSTFISDGTYTAIWEALPSSVSYYTVKHFLQNVDGSGYTEVENDRESKYGEIGSLTSAVAKSYTGFTAVAFEQAVIAEGSATVVEIKYNRILVYLTVYLNGGTTETSLTDGKVSCLYGGKVTLADPEKAGAVFDGWYEDSVFTRPFDFDSILTHNGPIHARFKYTVTFVTDGGNSIDPVIVKDGERLELPVPEKNGAVFAGWYQDEGYTAPFTVGSVAMNTVLYARWGYSVTFNSNAPEGVTASGSMENQLVYAGETVNLRENVFSCDGYLFNGWNTSADGSGSVYADKKSLILSENLVLYAQWIAAQDGFYPVIFDTHGGSSIDIVQVEDGFTVSRPADPVKANATFENWYTSSDFTTLFDFDTPITQATEIYARWQYMVTFNTSGGSEIAPVTVKDGETLTVPGPITKDGVVFDAWYISSSSIEAIVFPMTITADTTLYARWNCTVTFVVNGGNEISPLTVREGSSIILPDAEKTGLIFAGWYSDSDFSSPFTQTVLNTNTSIYARYKYNVSFDSNGGNGIMQNLSIYSDLASGTLPVNQFVRDGYVFLGWSTSSEVNAEVEFTDEGSVNFETHTTLYAVWAFRFTFVVVDNSDLTVSIQAGDNIILSARSGFTDYHWTIHEKEVSEILPDAVISSDGKILTFSAASVKDFIDRITVSAKNANGIKYMNSIDIKVE